MNLSSTVKNKVAVDQKFRALTLHFTPSLAAGSEQPTSSQLWPSACCTLPSVRRVGTGQSVYTETGKTIRTRA